MNEHRTPCTTAQLERYLRRIGHAGTVSNDAATLRTLHAAHVGAIAFENLEIHLDRPMRIAPDELFEDLVDRRRGGYCFQMNELFARALLRIGYSVERFAARVMTRNPECLPPRGHQVLRVTDKQGTAWFADVGFGGGSPLYPLPWQSMREDRQGIADYRLLDDQGSTVRLQIKEPEGDGWQEMLAFSQEEQWPVDFRYSNHAISTMPDSRFVMHRIAARLVEYDREHTGPVRHTFFDGTYRLRTQAGVIVTRELDMAEQETTLRATFGLDLPTPLVWRSPKLCDRRHADRHDDT